ncbi:B3GALT1 [Mytilus coruscus]|uniref:Hexosyltransferase n=1 Tax=Mytilus coruscus TaxID=42192 RepID=A0A6J8CN44_MYTCO|nr:B3GALT1 [Mytilus coruscus]
MIEHESLVHQDTVQGYFMDTYHNLTYKGVMGLKRITEHCRNAEFVAKIEYDVFMNFFKIFESLKFIQEVKKYIACNRLDANTKPIQRGINKDVHKDEFKRLNIYLYTSCSGFAVFMSNDLMPMLYKAALISLFFWVSDFYLFVILPAKIQGVVHYTIRENMSINYQRTYNCFLKYRNKCQLLVGLTNTGEDFLCVNIDKVIDCFALKSED